MKKNAFTLVELLAIIVILAIIALIAVPIVLDTINESKQEVAERSVENYVKAIETKVMAEQSKGRKIEGVYLIREDGNLCLESEGNNCTLPVEIKASGDMPYAGKVVIENGSVLSTNESTRTLIAINNYIARYDNNRASANQLCYMTNVGNMEVSTEFMCDFGDGAYNFNVLSVDDENVTLLMNSNLSGTAAMKAEQAEAELRKLTKNWIKLEKEQISLPTGNQLAAAAGRPNWDGDYADSNFYLPTWMGSNLYNVRDSVDGPRGYWTSTECSQTATTWYVYLGAHLSFPNGYGDFGVRPIVTVPKNLIYIGE